MGKVAEVRKENDLNNIVVNSMVTILKYSMWKVKCFCTEMQGTLPRKMLQKL